MEPASRSPLALFDREFGAVLYTFFKMLRLHGSVTRITEDPGPKQFNIDQFPKRCCFNVVPRKSPIGAFENDEN